MKTIINLFEESVIKYGANTFIKEKRNQTYVNYTYQDIKTEVYNFAAGLLALGIKKGDRVALLSEGSKNWVVSELGILYTGGVNVPLSVKITEKEDIRFRLLHAEVRYLIVSKYQAKKIVPLKDELSSLDKVIIIGDFQDVEHSKDILFEDVCKAGAQFLQSDKLQFEERWQNIRENDYANICYTSGTTADPKGIILSHRNYTANVEQSRSLMEVPEWYTTLLILPWDHAFAHTCGIYTVASAGASLAAIHTGASQFETLKNIPINIKEIKPTFLLSVPALAKNFKSNIEKGINEKGLLTKLLFDLGLNIAFAYNGIGFNKGKGLRKVFWPLNKLFDVILFKKIREAFGGRLKFFIGGGALLDIDLQHFFYAIGIPMYQGYGLTEAAPVISSNSERKHKLGSSGYLVSNLDLKICDDNGNKLPAGQKGEVVIQGENSMAGYWKNKEATDESLKNGWLHTGDLGYMDKDGFLYVVGRFKSLLIADDGEKFSPEGIEEAFLSHSDFVEQCMLFNNQKPYTVALIVPNKIALINHAEKHHIDITSLAGKKLLLKTLEHDLSHFYHGGRLGHMFPHRWLPAAIGIVPDAFTEENKMINSTLKMVRPRITEVYTDLIHYLYTPEAKSIDNQRNLNALSVFIR